MATQQHNNQPPKLNTMSPQDYLKTQQGHGETSSNVILENNVRKATTPNETTVQPETKEPEQSRVDAFKLNFLKNNPTPEELKEQEKRLKRNQLFSAIGDGVSAISNLVFTSMGAPNMYDGTNSMSKTAQARMDKFNADNEARKMYYNKELARLEALDIEDKRWVEKMKQLQEQAQRELELKRQIAQQNENYRREEQRRKKEQDEYNRQRGEQQFNETRRHNRAMEGIGWTRANNANNNKKEKKTKKFTYEGKTYNIPLDVWNTSWQALYDAHKEPGILPHQSTGYRDGENWIWANAQKNPQLAEALIDLSEEGRPEPEEEIEDYVPGGKWYQPSAIERYNEMFQNPFQKNE